MVMMHYITNLQKRAWFTAHGITCIISILCLKWIEKKITLKELGLTSERQKSIQRALVMEYTSGSKKETFDNFGFSAFKTITSTPVVPHCGNRPRYQSHQ